MALSANTTSTATLATGPLYLLGLYFRAGAAAGSVTLRDGGAGGTSKLVIDSPADATFAEFVDIGGGGIGFAVDMHVTLDQVSAVTVIYQ